MKINWKSDNVWKKKRLGGKERRKKEVMEGRRETNSLIVNNQQKMARRIKLRKNSTIEFRTEVTSV